MSLADLAFYVPLFIAVGGVETYFFAKLAGPRYRRWTGTMAAAWLLAAFLLMLLAVGDGFPTTAGAVFAPS